jgi:hypothetical protein
VHMAGFVSLKRATGLRCPEHDHDAARLRPVPRCPPASRARSLRRCSRGGVPRALS